MKIQLFILCGLSLFISYCQTNQPDNKTMNERNESKPVAHQFLVVDSLEKYYSADSVLLIDDSLRSTLFIRKVKDCHYALWVIPDSILVFFQHHTNEKWKATDTLVYNLDFSFSDYIDLNGDGFKDVRVCLKNI